MGVVPRLLKGGVVLAGAPMVFALAHLVAQDIVLRRLRREMPELFDGELALANIQGAIADTMKELYGD